MKLLLKKGTTSKLIRVFIQNSSLATGAGLTGLVFNSGSLTAYYIREGDGSATAITLATMTVGTWTSGGFKEIDATNMPGLYEVGLPNAVLASGANSVVVMLKGATNMAPVLLEIQLLDVDLQDATRFGLAALPTVAAGANGGLPLGDGSGRVDVGKWLGTAVTAATAGVPDVNAKNVNNAAAPTLTGDAYARIGANGAGLTALGDTRMANLDAPVSSRLPTASYVAPDNATITAINAKTTNLPASPASEGNVTAVGNAVAALNNISQAQVKAQADQALVDVGLTATITGRIDAAVSSRSTLTAANVWQYVIEGTQTAEMVLRILLSGVAGRLSGVLSNAPKFRDVANTKNRISATTTSDGRSTVTLDGS